MRAGYPSHGPLPFAVPATKVPVGEAVARAFPPPPVPGHLSGVSQASKWKRKDLRSLDRALVESELRAGLPISILSPRSPGHS